VYRGYCAHSSLVGVCSSGVCLIIRTAITNAWQNCPLCTGGDRRCRLQCVRADAPRSPLVSAVPLSVQCLQGSMELSASNTPVGKSSILSVSQQRSADASAPPRRGAYTPTLRAGARGRLCCDGGHARCAAQRGPCGGGPAALWARAGLLPAAGAAPAACIAETVQLSPHSAAPFTPSSFSATGGCR